MWRRFIELFPQDVRGYTSLAYSLKRIPGKEQEELPVREKVVEMRPDSSTHRFELAQCLRSLQRHADSWAQVRAAFQMMSPQERQSKDPLVNRAVALSHSGNYAAAIADLDALLAKTADHR